MEHRYLERKAVAGAILTVLVLLSAMVVASFVFLPRAGAISDGWWNASWKYRNAVTVVNPNSFKLIEYPTNITLDTMSLVSAGKMKPDGSDLRLVCNNDEIGFAVVDFNTHNTKIVFKSSVPAAESNSNYTLYYGNPSASDASSTYEKIKYEFIDEFNDGVIDPMWSFWYPWAYPPISDVPTHSESDGSLYIEKGAVDGIAVASATDLKINNSQTLRIQFRAYTAEVGWAGYWGLMTYLFNTNSSASHPSGDYLRCSTNTYDKSSNVAGPWLEFCNGANGQIFSTQINASRIDWTQTNNKWYDYDVYWNESNNFARAAMNATWYDNENTNGYFEDYSFNELWLGVFAYAPSGRESAKYDYIRIWQEVSQEPTASAGIEQIYAHGTFFAECKGILYPVEVHAPNCSISGFVFDRPQKQIGITATAGIAQYANITVPADLMQGALTVIVDDVPTAAITTWNLTLRQSGPPTGTISVHVDLEKGSHSIRIIAQFVAELVGDLNHDGKVDIRDLAIAAQNYGKVDP